MTVSIPRDLGGFDHFPRLQAVGADAQPLGCALDHRAHRAQINVPAPLADIMGVADGISKSRPLAANCAYLCHCR